jgi:hypothetical protein
LGAEKEARAQVEELVPPELLFFLVLLGFAEEERLVWDTGALLRRQLLVRALKRRNP